MTCAFKELTCRKNMRTYDKVASIRDHICTTGYISNAHLRVSNLESGLYFIVEKIYTN